MKNLANYENFFLSEVSESNSGCGCMSESAKKALEGLCKEMLCNEAQAYHDDMDESHTYEGYVDECAGYLKEIMGQAGYQSLTKTHAE